MFLKRHLRRKNGKPHVYYSLSESTRVSRHRVVQRRLLNLGELNTTQVDQWQRSIDIIEDNGQIHQRRLFTDRDSPTPTEPDACQVLLSSLEVKRPRQFGACWLGCRLFEELHLDRFFKDALAHHRGPEDWAKVVELLTVNRLCAPGSELSIHERWFDHSAMDFLLESGPEPERCSWRADFHGLAPAKVGRFSTALQLGIGLRIFSQSRFHQPRSRSGTAIFTVVLPCA